LSNYNLCFRPHKKGFAKILGDLETRVMEVVWRRKEVSVRDVFQELAQNRSSLAYTTILSTMGNLYRKGFLQRDKSGTAYLYHPVFTRDELATMAVNEVLKGLLESFSQPFMACLTGLGRDSDLAEAVENLEKVLAEREGSEY